jgi:hypothetical protein
MYAGLNDISYSAASYPNTTNPYAFDGQVPRIAVEFDARHLWEEADRQRRKLSRDKEIPPHVHSASLPRIPMAPNKWLIIKQRRRAQNRASQRAFRDRKEQYVKNLENQLKELGEKYKDLEKSYDDLNSSHDALKTELKRLTTEIELLRSTPGDDLSALLTPSPEQTSSVFFGEGVFDFGNGMENINTAP